MEFPSTEEPKEPTTRNEESKTDTDRSYFTNANDADETEFKNVHSHINEGPPAPKPSEVRNGDLVSLLLAATPPYLYNIPLVPQTFFFSEMLKSFVQAKTERQNLRAQQNHNRRQRKRAWKEMTPPNTLPYDVKDKPLELTIPKQLDDKQKSIDKGGAKKYQLDGAEKKYQNSKLGSSNFSVEKLANSSITSGPELITGNSSGDLVPPTPPMWYPFLYPPHPPYGIDPLHFFIDLRVSAHFWNRNVTRDEQLNLIRPSHNPNEGGVTVNSVVPLGIASHNSAFTAPPVRNDPTTVQDKAPKKNSRNVHYVNSKLRRIYESLRNSNEKTSPTGGQENGEGDEKRGKDLRALIGLELVVDYFKKKTNAKDDEPVVADREGTQMVETEPKCLVDEDS